MDENAKKIGLAVVIVLAVGVLGYFLIQGTVEPSENNLNVVGDMGEAPGRGDVAQEESNGQFQPGQSQEGREEFGTTTME